MLPINPEWPFRIYGDFIEQFSRSTMTWRVPKGNEDKAGYVMLNWYNGRRYFKRAHAVCWETHNGIVPDGYEIDHIDGDKSNNAITNLRLVTRAENLRLARERLGNWAPRKLTAWQMDLLLALPSEWCVLNALAVRWSVSKYSLGNIRAKAKRECDERYRACL